MINTGGIDTIQKNFRGPQVFTESEVQKGLDLSDKQKDEIKEVLEDYGKEPGTHGAAALYSRVAPKVNASKKPGEWQTYDIRLVGRDVKVVLNDPKVIDRGHIDGLTAIAMDADEGEPGPIILQGDHKHVEIRKVILTPLTH